MQIASKQLATIYRKLLYKNNLGPINIGYTSSRSWYDSCIRNFSDPLLNFILSPNPIVNEHIIFVNDPLDFSIQSVDHTKHIEYILFFHNQSFVNLKKEDIYILNNKISKYKKYSFSPIANNIIPDIQLIKYGFKEIDDPNILKNKSKSVLLIGEQKNLDQIIFSQIKQIYGDTDFLVISPDNLKQDIEKILIQYKVCINMSPNYNTLLAASNGCLTVSSVPEPTIPHHYVANNIQDIHGILKDIFESYTSHVPIRNYQAMIDHYNYNEFSTTIKNILNSINTVNIHE